MDEKSIKEDIKLIIYASIILFIISVIFNYLRSISIPSDLAKYINIIIVSFLMLSPVIISIYFFIKGNKT